MSNKSSALKTKIEIELNVPIEIKDSDGKPATRNKIILARPKLAQAKRLAIIIGPQFISGLMNETNGDDQAEIDMKALIVEVAQSIATSKGLDELLEVIAEMSGENIEVLNNLDWLDIIPVVTGFLGFFPTLQSKTLTKLVQT